MRLATTKPGENVAITSGGVNKKKCTGAIQPLATGQTTLFLESLYD